jgi:hypothetical protein
MIRTRKLIALSSILSSIFLMECDYYHAIKSDCVTAICTMEYRSITVTIKHKTDSTLYHLTDYKVIRISDNLDVTPKHDNLSDYSGYYSVANDSKMDLYKFNNVEVEFTGYVNNSIIIQRRFIVTADCCHISLVQGDTKFYL